jgi:ubiquitin-conjugating enzyme E2 variant
MQVTPAGETVIVPRNFKLLAELEKMEKGNTEMAISFGLVDGADVLLSNWNGGILGPHNVRKKLIISYLAGAPTWPCTLV